jgi:hypothetical protein
MKVGHWIAVIAALYFAAMGAVTFYNSYGGGTVTGGPDWGTVLDSTGNTNDAIAGALDLSTALAIYIFVLHKKVSQLV